MKFNILDYSAALTQVKGQRNRFQCPACNGNNLTINPKNGAYMCHSGNCTPQQVREALGAAPPSPKQAVFDSEAAELFKQIPIEQKTALKSEVDSQIGQASEDFSLAALLPSTIANPLIEYAERLNAPQGVFGVALLTVCASLLKIGTVIKLPGGTAHTEPPILWTCAYGESGNAKTPIQNVLLKGLGALSSDSYLRWQNAQEQYESDLLNWEAKPKKDRDKPAPKPPSRRVYKLNNLTTEGVVLKQSKQPENGFLIAVDELAGFFKSLNQYKSGGDDLEAWLSFYDGGGIEQVRVSREDIYLENVGFSVFGGIQPCKLKKAMGNLSEQDGFWPRYSYVRIPTQRMPDPEDLPDVDISAIEQLYRNLDNLPKQEYTLSPEARQVWRKWNSWIEDEKLKEGHEALRVLYPKVRARAARVALVLAAINQSCNKGSVEISDDVLKVAIAITKWMLRQTLSIYDELGLADNPEATKVSKFVDRFKDAGWIKAKAVTHWSSSSNKLNAQEARKFMAKVVDLGYAIENGAEPDDPAYEILIIQKVGNSVTELSQKLIRQGLESVTEGGNSLVTPVTGHPIEQPPVTGVTDQLPKVVTDSKPVPERDTENQLPSYRDVEEKYFSIADQVSKAGKVGWRGTVTELSGNDSLYVLWAGDKKPTFEKVKDLTLFAKESAA